MIKLEHVVLFSPEQMKFTESLVDQYCEDCSKCNGSCRHDELMKLIDTQPTAYDVDKVVK